MTDFTVFEERKRQFQDHLDRLMELLRQGQMVPDPKPDLHLLQGFRDGLAGDLLFRVLCVGDFSTGKSSFINRFLLEQDLLPAWPTPTTTLPTRIRHGECLKAIRYRPSAREGVDLDAEEATEDIAGTLKDWVSTAGSATDSPLPVIVEVPAPRLAAGVELIDAPGLNDPNAERMRLTLDYLGQADGVLFFVNALQPLSHYQKRFFEGEILTRDLLDRLFIIVNYWDQIEPAQRAEVFEYIEQQVRASLAKGAAAPAADLRIPILPVSAKTGENAQLIQQQVWDVLSARKFTDVLSLRIARFNKELDKYSAILAARLDMLALDPQGRSRRRAQLQQEIADYAQQREAFLAGLKRPLELDFQDYRDQLQRLFEALETEVLPLEQGALRWRSEREINDFLAQRLSRLQKETSRRLRDIDEAFVEQIKGTIEKEKATIGVLPTQSLSMEEYVLHWRGLDGNPLAQAAPIAGGAGIAGLLVGAGAIWQTATVTTATPGILTTIGTLFTGAPAAATSGFMLFGVPAIAVGALLLAGAFFFSRGSSGRRQDQVRAACGQLAERIEDDKWQVIDRIKANQAQRIAQICADVNDDITRAWREKLAELDAIQRIEDQGAALRALRAEIAALTLQVNP